MCEQHDIGILEYTRTNEERFSTEEFFSDPRPEHLNGYDGARQTRVQCDCFAATYGAARQLAEKVITAVAQPATAGGVVFGRVKAEGPRDLGEDTSSGFIHRASVDLLVEHRLA